MTPEIPFMPFPTMQNSWKPIVGFLIELVVLLPYATSTPPVLWPRDSSTCRIADSATAFKIKSSMAAKLRTSDVYKILQFSLRISPIKGRSLFFKSKQGPAVWRQIPCISKSIWQLWDSWLLYCLLWTFAHTFQVRGTLFVLKLHWIVGPVAPPSTLLVAMTN